MAEPKIQRSTSPQQELPQDEKNSSFQGMKGKGEHENNILTDSDPVTEDEQPPIAATNAGEPLSLPPKCMSYQRLIEKQSSTTPLSNEDITAPMLTQDAYQVNHSPYHKQLIIQSVIKLASIQLIKNIQLLQHRLSARLIMVII